MKVLARLQMGLSAIFLACVLCPCSAVYGETAADLRIAAVRASVDQLLSRYAANDPDAVVNLLDPRGFVIYGSDASEIVKDVASLRKMMADDFALWGSARFEEPSEVDIRADEELASVMFQVPFSAGGRPTILIRFTTLWRKVDGHWRLSQAANTVPTVGSSASELLRRVPGNAEKHE